MCGFSQWWKNPYKEPTLYIKSLFFFLIRVAEAQEVNKEKLEVQEEK